MLTQAELKELFHYDQNTGIFTRIKSSAPRAIKGAIAGGSHHSGYVYIQINGKKYGSHRLAWLYVYGVNPSNEIDHINGIKSDNRIINLRDVSRAENMQNLRNPTSKNKLGVLGVSFKKDINKYVAQIQKDKKSFHIGCFDDIDSAKDAYLIEKRKIHKSCTI